MTPKITENQKFPNFRRFMQFLSTFSIDFEIWNVEKSQQGTSLLSSGHCRRDNCGFRVKKISNWHRNRQKTQKFPIFKVFMQYLSTFR